MVRRKHRLLCLLTALAMLLSLMSGFTVFAEEPGEEQERYGLMLGGVEWDETLDHQVFNPDFMGDQIIAEAGRHLEFTIGWKNPDGTITPLTDTDMLSVMVMDSEGEKVDIGLEPAMYGYPDEETGRWEEARAGDGIYKGCFRSPGEYTIAYTGALSDAQYPEGTFVSNTTTVTCVMPVVALYAEDEISAGSLIGDEVTYMPGMSYYILADPLLDEGDYKTETTITGFEYDEMLNQYCKLEEIKKGEVYKLTVSERMDYSFSIRVNYEQDDYQKDDSEEFHCIREAENDLWINFNAPLRLGLVANWTHWDEENPDQPVFSTDDMRGSLEGYEIMAWNTFTFGWKSPDEKVTPIPVSDLGQFIAYDEEGNKVDGDWIRPATRWNEETDMEVELGDGYFDICFTNTGLYKIMYETEENLDNAIYGAVWGGAVYLDAVMPEVSIYSDETVSVATLIGPQVEYKDGVRTFYANVLNETTDTFKKECSLTGFEMQSPGDVDGKINITENKDKGYKIEIDDSVTDHFNIRLFLHIAQFRKEEGEWIEDGEWDRDYWVDFDYWEPEYYGLVAGFPKPVSEGGPMGDMQQYLDGFFELYGNSLVFAWRDAKDNEVQIREDDFIKHIKLVDEDGNDVPFRIEKQDNDDYIYDIWFDQQGACYLYYNGDMVVDEQTEGTFCQNWVKIWVDPPVLGVYDSEEFSEASLVGLSVEYQPDKLEYYLAGMSVDDERGSMKSYVTSVTVDGVEKPDFVTIKKNDDGTAKIGITKLPNKDYDGKFTLNVEYVIDSVWYDEQGEAVMEEHSGLTDKVYFLPGDGFNTSNISVDFKTEGATPAAPQIYIYNRGSSKYYDLSGNELSAENKWVTITPGTFMIENLPLGCYNIVENEEAAAVKGYDLVKSRSTLLAGGVMVEDGVTALVELMNSYESNQVIYPYKNEWVDGVWYNADGTQTYEPKGEWKHSSKGYWFKDSSGWYAKKSWQKIDGKSYYFDAKGYIVVDQYIGGYYLTKSGAWDGKGKAQWKGNATKGWWYRLPDGSYLKNCWAMIDGKYYYFKSNGYAAKNEWVKGYYWIGSNCVWIYKPKGSWHRDKKGWWFGDTSGWYAKSTTIVIDGKSYAFNASGYMK